MARSWEEMIRIIYINRQQSYFFLFFFTTDVSRIQFGKNSLALGYTVMTLINYTTLSNSISCSEINILSLIQNKSMISEG